MPKFCSNGHQMESSWEVCPYCQRTGFQNLNASAYPKTRLDMPEAVGSETSSIPSARRTLLINELPRPPVVGWLVALSGEQKGEDFRLREGQNTIGAASDCQVPLKDATVTGKHASLRYQDGKFMLTDLDSTNGTYLNSRADRILREELNDNDIIRIGDVSLKFKSL